MCKIYSQLTENLNQAIVVKKNIISINKVNLHLSVFTQCITDFQSLETYQLISITLGEFIKQYSRQAM